MSTRFLRTFQIQSETRSTHYKQTFGTAMGSPVSVTVANLVMEEIEEEALSTCELVPQSWKRYVDDTLTALALPADAIGRFHNHLNSINPHIQFTVEVESNNSLPFLDVLLTHESDGNITTSVYRKPTHTDKYLDLSSHHPLQHKISVIRTLFSQASVLSSSSLVQKEEEVHVYRALQMNGYPHRLIRRHKTVSSRGSSRSEEKPIASVTLPYVQGTSERLRRVLSNLDIRVTFRPHCTLRHLLVKPKDPVPPDRRKGVVYKISCKHCSYSYIGQTGRSLSDRIKEHKRAVSRANVDDSALAEHVVNSGHEIDWCSVP